MALLTWLFIAHSLGHFTFWISLSLRPKTETKRLNFGLSPELRLTNRRSALTNVIADVIGDSSLISSYFLFIFELAKK